MSDQQFLTPTNGAADWDASLNANFTALERGFYATAQAGMDVNTGYVIWINSGNFMFHFDPNSRAIQPHGMALTSASSGDTLQVLLWGIARSLGITSPAVPGIPCYVSGATPGLIVGSYSGADRPVGFGLGVPGLVFAPGRRILPEQLTRTVSVVAVTGSLHYFTMDSGQWGWVSDLRLRGNSGDFVNLWFHSGSTRAASELLYQTKSGGVWTIGDSAHWDRAGWPYRNTLTNTISGLIWGTLQIDSASAVGSDGFSVTAIFDRSR